MKSKASLFCFFFIALNLFGQNENWKYLGQEPPKSKPKIFAQGIISTQDNQEMGILFSTDLKEIFFGRKGKYMDRKFEYDSIIYLKYENGSWNHPKAILPGGSGLSFSPDGNRLYRSDSYIERTDFGWSGEIKQLGPPLSEYGIVRSSVSSKGTIFFENRVRGPWGIIPENPVKGRHGIYYSRLKNGEYSEPEFLIEGNHPCVALDESYVIFDTDERNDGFGGDDLYILFQKKDGSWSEPINLGENINSYYSDFYASISPDGKYLFYFHGTVSNDNYKKNGNIWWVEASIIDELREKLIDK